MSVVKSYTELTKERGKSGQGRTTSASPRTASSSPYKRRWGSPVQKSRPQSSTRGETTTSRRNPNNHNRSHPTPTKQRNWGTSVTTTKQRNWGPYFVPDGTLPYAYQPTNEMFVPGTGFLRKQFKIPSFWEVVEELGWLIFEAVLAAAGQAVFQFFAGHRRFHPGPGKM